MIPALRARRVPALRLDPPQHVHRRAGAARRRASSCATGPNVRFAGLLTGVEGYIESCAMGLVVAWLLAGELDRPRRRRRRRRRRCSAGSTTTSPRRARASYKYGPTNVNYGLLPPLPGVRKDNRKQRMAERARADFDAWLAGMRSAPLRSAIAIRRDLGWMVERTVRSRSRSTAGTCDSRRSSARVVADADPARKLADARARTDCRARSRRARLDPLRPRSRSMYRPRCMRLTARRAHRAAAHRDWPATLGEAQVIGRAPSSG